MTDCSRLLFGYGVQLLGVHGLGCNVYRWCARHGDMNMAICINRGSNVPPKEAGAEQRPSTRNSKPWARDLQQERREAWSGALLASCPHVVHAVEIESIRKMLARAADTGHSNQHNA